jgi:hypothetical protein
LRGVLRLLCRFGLSLLRGVLGRLCRFGLSLLRGVLGLLRRFGLSLLRGVLRLLRGLGVFLLRGALGLLCRFSLLLLGLLLLFVLSSGVRGNNGARQQEQNGCRENLNDFHLCCLDCNSSSGCASRSPCRMASA